MMSARQLEVRGIVLVGALGGLLAGVVLALTEMIYGWASSAHTAWDAPMAFWAWFAGLNYFGQPSNHIGPIILGLGVLLVYSMLVGVIFVALLAGARMRTAARMRNDVSAVVLGVANGLLGVAYGLVLWVVVRYVILPLRDSTKELFTTSMVSPQWVWWLAYALFGLTLGAVVYASARRMGMRPPARVSRMREETRRAAA